MFDTLKYFSRALHAFAYVDFAATAFNLLAYLLMSQFNFRENQSILNNFRFRFYIIFLSFLILSQVIRFNLCFLILSILFNFLKFQFTICKAKIAFKTLDYFEQEFSMIAHVDRE